MATKLTRLTHKIAIQLHIMAESSTICSCRSRWPVRKLLDTLSYVARKVNTFFVGKWITGHHFGPLSCLRIFANQEYIKDGNIKKKTVALHSVMQWLLVVSFQSESVGRAMYETPWLEGQLQFRRSVTISVTRAQATLQLTGGKIYVMSLETFQAVSTLQFQTQETKFKHYTRVYPEVPGLSR
jgi:hypothetical protein